MKKKLNILEVNKFYYPHIGGIETVIQQQSEYFNSVDSINVKVLTCTEKGKGGTEKINGVEIIRCSSIGTYFSCPLSFGFFRKFKKLSKWANIIVVHVPFPPGDLATLLSGFKGKVIIYWHSDIIKQKKLLMIYRPILIKFLNRADAIFTATEKHISSSIYLPKYRQKCYILPYGINVKKYVKISNSNILTNKLKNSKNIKIFFTGRLVYYKGVEILLKAFFKIKDQNAELFLAGDGVLKENLIQLCKKENISDKVHFLGKLSKNDLLLAFSDCDIFVLPSIQNSEAFGIVQLEAMIYSKPVINTSLPTGVPLVSIDGKTGLTVEPGDVNALAFALKKLINSKNLRETYGKNAKLRVIESFNLDKINKTLYKYIYNIYNK